MQARELAAYRRLKKSGEWQEACLFRDTIRKCLRSEGWTKSAANAESWRRLFAKYPDASGVSDADFLWCLHALAADHLFDESPPSGVAVMLLNIARRDLSRFLVYFASQLLESKSAFAAPLAALLSALPKRDADMAPDAVSTS